MSEENDKKFTWPRYPQSIEEFESLMRAADAHLASQDRAITVRPLLVGTLFNQAFGWSGPAFPPKELANYPGFDGPVLLAKSYRWYDQVYGTKLHVDFALGHAPYRLGKALWRVRFPLIFGRCRLFIDRDLKNCGNSIASKENDCTLNMLCCIEELPQGFADRVKDRELNDYLVFFMQSHQAFAWRDSHLGGHELLVQAKSDYAASVDDILSRRYAQSRWASAQAVEKTLKAILSLSGIRYSTSGKAGHDIVTLAEKLAEAHQVNLHKATIDLVQCSPAVRYGEESSSEDQALHANHAVLAIIERLFGQRAKLPMLKPARRPRAIV